MKIATVRQVAELVRLVADGIIPREEVQKLIARARTTPQAKAKDARDCMKAALRALGKIKDDHDRFHACVKLYSVTGEERYLIAAIDYASDVKGDYYASSAYAGLYSVTGVDQYLTASFNFAKHAHKYSMAYVEIAQACVKTGNAADIVDSCVPKIQDAYYRFLMYAELYAMTKEEHYLVAALGCLANVKSSYYCSLAYAKLHEMTGAQQYIHAACSGAASSESSFHSAAAYAELYGVTKEEHYLGTAVEHAANTEDAPAYAEIGKACAKTGNIAAALEYAAKVKDPCERFFVYIEIYQALVAE